MRRTRAFVFVLLFVCSFAACGVESAVEEAAPGALPPQIMVDGVIYVDTGLESTAADRQDSFDGEITSTVMGHQQPSENDQSNFGTGFGYQFGEQEGTVDLFSNGRWWIYATREVRHQLQFPEQYIVVGEPPALIVNHGEASVEARECLINWEFTMEDGKQSAMMGDGAHPLAKNSSPAIILDPELPLEVWLSWEIMPDVVTVSCWSEDCWEQLESEPVESFRLMESNEAGDRYLLRPKNGNYIYEIIATWQNAPNFGGTVHYSFHTETGMQ